MGQEGRGFQGARARPPASADLPAGEGFDDAAGDVERTPRKHGSLEITPIVTRQMNRLVSGVKQLHHVAIVNGQVLAHRFLQRFPRARDLFGGQSLLSQRSLDGLVHGKPCRAEGLMDRLDIFVDVVLDFAPAKEPTRVSVVPNRLVETVRVVNPAPHAVHSPTGSAACQNRLSSG